MSEETKKFKIGEVSRIVDIPVESIRFFETKGLISPQKDAFSKYRYYDVWDINRLLDYRKLRNMDFSLGQAIEIINDASLEEFIESIHEKELESQKLARMHQLKAIKFQNYQNVLKNIPLLEGYYQLSTRPASWYIMQRVFDGESFAFSQDPARAPLMELYSFAENMYRMSADTLQKYMNSPDLDASAPAPVFEYGLTIKKMWADTLDLDPGDSMEFFEAVPAVYTIVKAVGKENFSIGQFQGLLDFMKSRNFEIAGDLLGNVVASVKENGSVVRYMEVWLPYKEAD